MLTIFTHTNSSSLICTDISVVGAKAFIDYDHQLAVFNNNNRYEMINSNSRIELKQVSKHESS